MRIIDWSSDVCSSDLRAHVLRGRAHHSHARDDPGLRREGAARGARQAAAVPAPGLRRAVPDHGRAAGDDPPARPAAARVPAAHRRGDEPGGRSEEHTSELQSLMRISYAVFCLTQKTNIYINYTVYDK